MSSSLNNELLKRKSESLIEMMNDFIIPSVESIYTYNELNTTIF